jgi:hypothetical protein
MKLETFYAYANEAPCISLNRKTQQTTMCEPAKISKENPLRNLLFDTAISETNSCYHLFQHSLVSFLILMRILNDAANSLLSCAEGKDVAEKEDIEMLDVEDSNDVEEIKEVAEVEVISREISATCSGDRDVS